MRSHLALLVASVFLAGISPTAPAQEGQDAKPPLTKAGRAAAKKLQERMQGAWRLVEMKLLSEESRLYSDLDLQHTGYAVVHDGYFSLEFHMRLVDKNDVDYGQSLASGLHRFDLDGVGFMDMTTVIASRTRRDGSIEFEPPGMLRKYRVVFEGDRMVLTRDDGHRLVFERLQDSRPGRFDIFGRPAREDAEPGEEKPEKPK